MIRRLHAPHALVNARSQCLCMFKILHACTAFPMQAHAHLASHGERVLAPRGLTCPLAGLNLSLDCWTTSHPSL